MNLKEMIFLSLLVSIGLILSIVESFIPLPIPVPGVKLGLVNIVFLLGIVLFGLKRSILIVIIRSLTLGIASGNISGLIYGLPSSVMSTIVMAIVYKKLNEYFSLVGVSIFGAITFNIVQICIVSIIMQNTKMFVYIPFMSLTSIVTGCFIGFTVKVSEDKIKSSLSKIKQ